MTSNKKRKKILKAEAVDKKLVLTFGNSKITFQDARDEIDYQKRINQLPKF